MSEYICQRCEGSGEPQDVKYDTDGFCNYCEGTGRISEERREELKELKQEARKRRYERSRRGDDDWE
ncbi:hypothetical protein [Flammeovirga sp. OC4]|uniref:hypothetical protein n=1 Tax=Flammeovirga sp. OC4 TaxID=1382345 RepID=UPI0005C662AB|nr:hypothetical protein [Flammeovirga sp. OC4]